MRAAFRSCVLGISLLILLMSQVQAAGAYDPKTAPKPIELIPPEYPAIARRFNIQGAVTIALLIGTSGRVINTQIIETTADVLSQAVLNATPQWTFTKPDEPTITVLRFPFRLTESGETAFRFGIRRVVEAPILKDELGQGAVNGWGEVHLIISNGESVDSHHITRISDPSFRQTLEGIINRLRFASEEPDGKPWSVNIFKIQVDDLSITIDQRPGE